MTDPSTGHETRHVGRLIEAALDVRDPSPEFKAALNEALSKRGHPLRDKSRDPVTDGATT